MIREVRARVAPEHLAAPDSGLEGASKSGVGA